MGKARDLNRRAEWIGSQTFVVLAIHVPKDNEKTPASAEQFFAALHGIYRGDPIVQEHLSFEIVAAKESIIFYVFTPLHLRDFVEGQLYAQYPDLVIKQVGDYTKEIDLEGQHVAVSKIQLTKEDVYPIKTFTGTDVDPLAGITAVLSGLEGRERVWIQMVVRPVGDKWQDKGIAYVQGVRSGKKSSTTNVLGTMAKFGFQILQEAIQPGSASGGSDKPSEPPKLSAPQEAALKGVEGKVTKLGFETLFRLVVIAPDVSMAKARGQAVLAAFKQFNTTNLNGFIGGEVKVDDYAFWQKFITREFEEKGNVMNIEELASVYHFPAQSVETSAISWAGSKKGEAPFNLPLKEQVDPKELTVLGRTDYRNQSKEFGIKLEDRKRHIYVIGKSGVGKSVLLENMILDDVFEGRGVIVVDPHGELADKIVESVPENRIQDVIILDPADREFPISFNPLEKVSDDFKGMVASGFVGIFKKIFGNSWGPRLEYILRNTVLALLDSESPTMLGIPRMLTEAAFRNQVIDQIKDTVIRDFWVNEFGGMDAKQRSEAIAPILNKVGQFLSTSTIRNLVGQPTSTFDIRKIMDQEKIFIVNLSKGKIGEDNMALLGAMIITKVQLAAMSRSNVSVDKRPNCFLYVDEFQNFATESFATILSEARKYNLGLTIAHQYIKQMSDEVRDAVIGNAGTLLSFRVGGDDVDTLVKEFAPVFDGNDLLNLQKYHVYIKLLVDGIAAPAFSATTLAPRHIEASFRDRVIEHSRSTYARPRADVEANIEETGGYRQKREAENAAKSAQEFLRNANQAIGIRPNAPQGAAAGAPAQQARPVPNSAAPAAAPVSVQQPRPVQSVLPTAQPIQQAPQPVRQAPVQAPQPRVEQAPAQAQSTRSEQLAVHLPQTVAAPQPAVQTQAPARVQPPQSVAAPVASPAEYVQSLINEHKPKETSQPRPVFRLNTPQVQAASVPQPAIEAPEVLPMFELPPEEPAEFELPTDLHEEPAGQGKGPFVPRKEKPLKVIDGWAYKEVSQRGGMKWYLSEPETEIMERQEQKRVAKELTAQQGAEVAYFSEADPLPVISPPEQRANEFELPVVQPEPPQRVVAAYLQPKPVAVQKTEFSISEGQSIIL